MFYFIEISKEFLCHIWFHYIISRYLTLIYKKIRQYGTCIILRFLFLAKMHLNEYIKNLQNHNNFS